MWQQLVFILALVAELALLSGYPGVQGKGESVPDRGTAVDTSNSNNLNNVRRKRAPGGGKRGGDFDVSKSDSSTDLLDSAVHDESETEERSALLSWRKRAPGSGKRAPGLGKGGGDFDVSKSDSSTDLFDSAVQDESEKEERSALLSWRKRAPGSGKRAPGRGKRSKGMETDVGQVLRAELD